MGKDGARTVIVNSVGREMGELERSRADRRPAAAADDRLRRAEGDRRRLQGASGFNGAAVVLDPAHRRGARRSPAGRRTTRTRSPPGIDRVDVGLAEHRRPAAAAEPGDPGPVLARVDVQDGRRRSRRSRKGVITPDFKVHCAGGANFYGRYFKCWKKGGHGTVDLRHAIEQSCDVYFYTVANMLGVDKINKWATLLGLGVKSGIDLPNEVAGPRAVHRVEAGSAPDEKWYAGETISVGIGQGQVSVTPVSMAVYMATLANGGTRVTPHLLKAVDDGNGLEAGAGAAAAVARRHRSREAAGDPRRPVDGRQRAAARAAARGSSATTSAGKTGTAQVISNQGRVAAARQRQGPARQRLVRLLRAARQPADRRRRLPRARHPRRRTPPSVAHHILDTFFAKQDGRPLPPPPTHDDLRLDFTDPVRRSGTAATRRAASERGDMSRTTPLLPHRLGAARRGARCCARWASR